MMIDIAAMPEFRALMKRLGAALPAGGWHRFTVDLRPDDGGVDVEGISLTPLDSERE